MVNLRVFGLMVVALTIFVVTQVMFVVKPDQAALVVHLGDLNTDENGDVIRYDSGLHLKYPLIDRLVIIDKRLQSFEVPSTRVLTQDQKSVNVDYYAKWRVHDFPLFFRRTGANYFEAREILKKKISDALRAEFGTRDLSEIISGDERTQIIERMQKVASESAENIGVRVQDVRLKRVDYPQEVALSVYERMKSSRHRDANRYRAEGSAEAEKIRSEADKDAAIIIAKAKRNAAERVAEARRAAAEVFNSSYSKAPDFYNFYLKMQGYNHTITSDDTMVLSPENDRFYSILADG